MIQPIKDIFTNWRNVQHHDQGDPMETLVLIEGGNRWRLDFSGYGSVTVEFAVGELGNTETFLQGVYDFDAVPSTENNRISFRSNLNYLRAYELIDDEKWVKRYEYIHP